MLQTSIMRMSTNLGQRLDTRKVWHFYVPSFNYRYPGGFILFKKRVGFECNAVVPNLQEARCHKEDKTNTINTSSKQSGEMCLTFLKD